MKFFAKHKKICITIALAFIAVGGWYWWSARQAAATASTVATPTMHTVATGDISVAITATGQVEAQSQADLQAGFAGDGLEVVSVAVTDDQTVTKNQIIAVLKSTDTARDLQSALLNLRQAEIKMKQTKDLYKKETKEDKWQRQTQEAAVAQARISVSKAQSKVSDYTIRAPFDGIVTGLSVGAGDTVSSSTVLASVITPTLEVAITLNEVDAAKVTKGSAVLITFDALPGVTMNGVLNRIDTIGKVTSGVVSYGATVTLSNQNEKLRPGMSATAEIVSASKSGVVLVPNEYLKVSDTGEVTVNVRQASPTGKAEVRKVTVGITDDVVTEVVSGLSAGETLVSGTMTGTARPTNTNPLQSLLGGNRRPAGTR